jgi:hypothetical protein
LGIGTQASTFSFLLAQFSKSSSQPLIVKTGFNLPPFHHNLGTGK